MLSIIRSRRPIMSAEKEIRELATNRRHSAKRIPFYGALLLFAWLLFWLLNTVIPIPRWLLVVVSLIMGYSFVGELTPDFADVSEAFLIEFLIDRLGDVTPGDHRAIAHALFRQFDSRVPLDSLEDRVAILLAQLADRITLSRGIYSHRSGPQ